MTDRPIQPPDHDACGVGDPALLCQDRDAAARTASRIAERLSPAARSAFPAVHGFEHVDSTNTWLLSRPQRNAGRGEICIANRQTAGRGRRGRRWISPQGGNLYLSASWQFPAGGHGVSGLGLVIGVVVAESVRRLGAADVQLKWPNDLVSTHGKLGGVLVEASGSASADLRVVAGIGINVRPLQPAVRERLDQPTADLQSLIGCAIDAEDVALGLVEALAVELQRFEQHGLAAFEARWHALDALRDRPITVRDANGEWNGTAVGIACDGALKVHTSTGLTTVHAADVSVRPRP